MQCASWGRVPVGWMRLRLQYSECDLTMPTDPRGNITLESLDEPNEVPYLQMNTRDFFVQAGGAAFGFQAISYIGGGPIIGAAVGAICFIAARNLVKSAPPYFDIFDWGKILLAYARHPAEYSTTEETYVDSSDSLYSSVRLDATTTEKTNIKRFYPPFGIVERQNGTYYMVVRYEPPNLDFATAEDYTQIASAIDSWVNQSGDFSFGFYATGSPVDMEGYFDNLAERAVDGDIKQSEVFSAVVDEMRVHRRRQLAEAKTESVEYYFIVEATEDDVSTGATNDESATDRSFLFRLFSSGDSDAHEEEDEDEKLKQEIQQKLRRRAKAIEQELVGKIDGADASIATVDEASAVLEEYWTGTEVDTTADDDQPAMEAVPMSRVAFGEETGDDEEVVMG